MACDLLAEFAEALANPLEYLSKIERNEAMLAILEDFEGQVNVICSSKYLLPCNYQLSKSIVHEIKFCDIAVM